MKNDFTLGYIAAVANMVSSHGIGVPAEEALKAIGIDTIKKLRESGCSEYDFLALKKMVNAIERGGACSRKALIKADCEVLTEGKDCTELSIDSPVIIICGGRDYEDGKVVYKVLNELMPSLVVEGGAAGADFLARKWCKENGVENITYKAQWLKYGGLAGPIRNNAMLEGHPTALVVAFPGGEGTLNCVSEALKRGMRVVKIDHR